MRLIPVSAPQLLTRQRAKRSSNVPDKYYGYTVQTVRCLSRLIEAMPGSIVSVEVFEDVGEVYKNGGRIAEQDKSALGHNPVADRAKDLWKTLSNWVDASCNGTLDPSKTQYIIFITAPHSDDIVNSFHNAHDTSTAKSALQKARNVLWGPHPTYPKKSSVASTIAAYVKNVFTHNPPVSVEIVRAFSLVTGSGAILEDVRGLLMRKTLVDKDNVDDVLRHALGWVTEELITAIEHGVPANISVDAFNTTLFQFIRRHDTRLILHSLAPAPTSEKIKDELALRRYVRQLALVECDEEVKVEAVTDYLKALSDRTSWAAQGYIDEDMLRAYETTLSDAWRNIRRKSEIAHSHLAPCKRGQLVMLDCTGQHFNLDVTEVPPHFPRGSFHALADKPTIGWHPNYENLLDATDEA